MKEFLQYIESLGGLHDSDLIAFKWHAENAEMEIEVGDLYAVYEGTDGYLGRRNGRFVFSNVSSLTVEVRFSEEALLVYNFQTKEHVGGGWLTTIRFSPGGMIVFAWTSVEWQVYSLKS